VTECYYKLSNTAVASLGLLSPRAATDGCQPISLFFLEKNLTTLVIVSDSDNLF